MGVIIPQVITNRSGAQIIDGSLKFDGTAKTHLTRTVPNITTFTLSFWYKTNLVNRDEFFDTASSTGFYFYRDGQIKINDNSSNIFTSNGYYRDSNSFYHVVLNSDGSDVNLYVNGVLDKSTSVSTQLYSGTASISSSHATDTADYYLSQYYFIDGQALTPDSFGFTDGLTNTWKPKKYEGTFGTNGFYLPMDGNSPIGQDQSGQGNDFTPVNFGGSVTLDSPLVTGARPILNTTPGGTQAGVGVFGSKQNVGYAVTVYNDGGGNKYYIDGVKQDTVTGLIRGATYTFDTSDSTVSSHPFRFSATSNGSHGGGSEYTNGVAAITGAATTITVPYNAPNTLYYYCTSHSGMGADITGITTNEKLADQYASHCTLALPLVGADDDVCASIACTSNNKTPTNSSVTASTTQSNFYGGSHHWSANSDTLQYAEQGDELVLGTGDFTIEFWYFDDGGHSGTGGRTYLFDNRIGGSVTGDPPTLAGWLDGVEVNLYITGGGGTISYDGSVENKWHHYAAVRSGSTVTLYHDGVARGTMTSSTNFTNNGIGVGRATDANYGFAGYMQDFRVYKGIAKYTSDFVIPATSPDILPDTPSGVSGSSKLTKITDGAVGFGTNAYMTTTSSDYNPGTGDFAIEGYFRFPDNSGTRRAFINDTGTFGNNSLVIRQYNTGFEFYCGGTSFSDSGYNMAQWNHAMITRSGSTVRIFVNGELRATRTTSQSISCEPTNQMTIGGFYDSGGGSEYMRGHASNLRLTVGSIPTDYQTSLTSVGVKVFTPSSEPLTSTSQGATSSDVKLLCCQSPTSATTAAVASASLSTNNAVEGTTFNPFNTDINTVRGQETGYATLNPLDPRGLSNSPTFSEGNLRINDSSSYDVVSTMGADSGRWYWEVEMIDVGTTICGIIDFDNNRSSQFSMSSPTVYYATTRMNGTREGNQSGGTDFTYTDGDIVAWALDVDNLKLYGYKNGVLMSTATITQSGVKWAPYVYGESTTDHRFNFGQKPFKYSPPDGFQPLNTANTRPVKVISRPDQYVGIVTYTGNGTTGQSIKGLNFDANPDLVWIKSRSFTNNHHLFDTVRGPNKIIRSSTTDTEDSSKAVMPSFDFNGFSVDEVTGNNATNDDGSTFVAWCWKAGGNKNTFNVDDVGYASAAAAGLNGGGITPTGASVGTKQGFSIIKYTGTGSAATISHGLSSAPACIFVKTLDDAYNWFVYHKGVDGSAPEDYYLRLNTQNARVDSSNAWNDTAPTSTLFTVGTDGSVNESGDDYIAYLWHDVPGLQKFGTYTGNGNADGPFIELGFLPSVIIIKRSDGGTENWTLWDATRNPTNVMGKQLYPNLDNAEADAGTNSSFGILDFVSNGVKIRGSHSSFNSSGHTFIYMAWAAAPSVDLFGGGANAR